MLNSELEHSYQVQSIASEQSSLDINHGLHNLYSFESYNMLGKKQSLTDKLAVQQSISSEATQKVQIMRQENQRIEQLIKLLKNLIEEKKQKLNIPLENLSLMSTMLGRHAVDDRVGRMNQNMHGIIGAFTALDSLVAICRTIKESVKQASRVTIFVVDQHLQKCIVGGKSPSLHRHAKRVLLEKRQSVYAIFRSDKEQCTPCYGTLRKAR
jgi:hypothetical protein